MEHKFGFNKSNCAIIILHEIYGVNEFIKDQCREFTKAGFSVFCPNLLKRAPFAYEDSAKAYAFFFENVGFKVYTEINELINQLKDQYSKVFVLGFSIGATLAWRCSENTSCSGIIAYYGSRIRDYTDLCPACPALLIFAKEDSFDVRTTVERLNQKLNTAAFEYEAKHGFFDCYAPDYDKKQAAKAEADMNRFIKLVCGKEEEKIMNIKKETIDEFWRSVRENETALLATAAEGSVTMRTMSPVYYEDAVLIFTSPQSQKYKQLKENPNCCIKVGRFFAEAKSVFLGSTMTDGNARLREVYERKFNGAFSEGMEFGGRDAEFILLKPEKVKGWNFEEGADPDGIPTIPFEEVIK